MQVLGGRRERIDALAFSRCGRWLAASGYDRGFHVWDTAHPVRAPHHPPDVPTALELFFRPDGRLVYFDTSMRCWQLNLETLDRAQVGRAAPWYGRSALSPDGDQIAQPSRSPALRVWNFQPDGSLAERQIEPSTTRGVRAVAYSPDGGTLAAIEMDASKSWAVLRRTDTFQRTAEAECFNSAMSVQFTPDGARVVVTSGGSLAAYDPANFGPKPRKAVNPSRRHFLSTAFHPGGHFLTVDNDRLVKVWDLGALAVVRAIEWNVGKLYAVAVSPDGSRAAVGSHTGKVLVWDWD